MISPMSYQKKNKLGFLKIKSLKKIESTYIVCRHLGLRNKKKKKNFVVVMSKKSSRDVDIFFFFIGYNF